MLNVLALLSRPSKSCYEPIFLAMFPITLHYALHANRTDFPFYIGTAYFCPADFVMMPLSLECSSSSPHIHVQSTIPRSHSSATSSNKVLNPVGRSHLLLLRTHAELYIGLSNDNCNVLLVLVIFGYDLCPYQSLTSLN